MKLPGCLFCLFLGSLHATAQPAPVPSPLTISQAITLTLQKNPELAAAQAELRQSQASYQLAGSLPTASLSAGLSRGEGPAALSSFSGIRRDEFVQIQQSFMPFGAMKKGQFVAWLHIQENEAQVRFLKISLMRQTKDAFYTLLARQEQVKVFESNLLLARQIFEATEKRAGKNPAGHLELLAARVQSNQVQQSLITTAGQVESARADLAPLLGLASGVQLLVTGDLDTNYGHLQLQDMLALGEKSPALEAARQATLSSHEQVKLASLQGNPTPSLTAVYDFRIPSYIVGAQLSFPLDWGQIGYDVQAHSEAATAQEARFRSLVLDISSQIHKAYAEFIAASKNSDSYEREVLRPEEDAVKLVQEEFARRKVDYDEVLLGQQQLEEIRLEYLRQRLLERLALNALEEAVGSPVEKLTPEPEGLRT